MAATRTTQIHQDGQLVSEDVEVIGPVDANVAAISSRMRQALSSNADFLSVDAPTAEQASAQVEALTMQVNAIIRMSLGEFDTADDTGPQALLSAPDE